MGFTLTTLFAPADTLVMTLVIGYFTGDIKLTNCNCISYQGHHAPSVSITAGIFLRRDGGESLRFSWRRRWHITSKNRERKKFGILYNREVFQIISLIHCVQSWNFGLRVAKSCDGVIITEVISNILVISFLCFVCKWCTKSWTEYEHNKPMIIFILFFFTLSHKQTNCKIIGFVIKTKFDSKAIKNQRQNQD